MKQSYLICCHCQQTYSVTSIKCSRALSQFKIYGTRYFCSKACRVGFRGHELPKKVICLNCKKEFFKKACELRKRSNSFCSRSCSATYNNTHKKHGTRRSKLEVYLEKCLTNKYKELDFLFNKKETINSELDIYIPSLKLAFELNGIYHYEPIHGLPKLTQIQNNDNRKFQACLEQDIELCIIDTSSMSYFKPINANKYLDIICNIIDKKVVPSSGVEPELSFRKIGF